MDFFISDTHFFHKNIISFCKRPFSSVEEMNECLISNWNKRVNPTDTVYFLGDFSFGSAEQTSETLRQLNGHKHLLWGNHDRDGHSKFEDWHLHFHTFEDYRRIRSEGHKFVLCHFPFASWERGYVNLHGHTHGTYPSKWAQHDVGVDVNGFMPITSHEAYNLAMDSKKERPSY